MSVRTFKSRDHIFAHDFFSLSLCEEIICVELISTLKSAYKHMIVTHFLMRTFFHSFYSHKRLKSVAKNMHKVLSR